MNPREIVTIVKVVDANTGKTFTKMAKNVKDYGRRLEETTTMMDKNNKVISHQTKTISGLNERFQMHYLSVMFFGMQIQRMFLTMSRTGTDMLVKITEGATAQAQAIIGLGAEWDFLQFSIGEAIGSWIEANPWLMKMIEGVSDWIEQNQQLVGWLIIAGTILATFLFVVGTSMLGIKGIIMMMDAWALAVPAWTVLTANLSAGWATLSTTIWGTIIPIAAAAGAIALLYLIWENNLFGMKDATYDVFSEIARMVIQLSKGIMDFAIMLLEIQTRIEGVLGVKNKAAMSAIKDLKAGKNTLEDLLEFSYTPDAKAGVMDYKPVTEAMQQILSLQTNVTVQAPTGNSTVGFDYEAIGKLIGKGQADEIKAQLAGTNF